MTELKPQLEEFAATEQARLLHRNGIVTLAALSIIAIILVVSLAEIIPRKLLVGWISVYLALTFIRLLETWLYQAHNDLLQKPIYWTRVFAIGSIASGVTWGAAAVLFSDVTEPSSVILLVCLMVAVVAAAAQALSPYLPAFVGFSAATILPLTWTLISTDNRYSSVLGVFAVLYLFAISGFAFNSRRLIKETIQLRFENMELIERLSVEKAAAEASRKAAEKATVAKSKFLAAASHDLRQPLHALGFFQDALETHVAESGRRIMAQMRQSISALGGLFDSLLDISRLDAGVIESKPQHVSIPRILKSIEEEFRPLAAEKGLQLVFGETEATAYADPVMLDRTLRNLVSNAIRYTDVGSVTIKAKSSDSFVEVSVADTGVGIHEDQFEKIFSEYHQLHNPERDRTKGLGLGLSIVRRLCDLMQAEIKVESTVGRGAKFSLRIPLGDPSSIETVKPRGRWDLSGAVVVVIDDESDILEGMGGVMRRWGCEPILASSAGEALQKMAIDSRAPTAIIADYRLKDGETGITAIRLVRQRTGRCIPALLVSGDTAPDRLQEVRNSGLRLLHKPVSPAELRTALFQELTSPPK